MDLATNRRISATDTPSPLCGVWRAAEMSMAQTPTIPSGHDSLDRHFPGNGWPRGALIELMLRQAGIGEMQLLAPVLAKISQSRRIALIHPPYFPHLHACRSFGLAPENLLWVKAATTADVLWSAEQILKSGDCGALVLWQSNVRNESLRRLHLAAKGGDTLFWMVRPTSVAADTSPAPLRLALHSAAGGVMVDIVKRRGPKLEQPIFVRLARMPINPRAEDPDGILVKRLPAPVTARSASTAVV